MADLLGKIGEILPKDVQDADKAKAPSDGKSFGELLKQTVDETNELQQMGEKATVDIATGQVQDLHKAAIAIGKAETSMKMILEVRNKAVSAYKDLLRTQM